jgi:hypothetical protein
VRKVVLFTIVLFIAAAGLQTLAAGQSNGNSSEPTTLQGCLAFADGHYRLTDSNGVSHQLTGAANRLTHYVNKQIEITGTPAVRTVDTTQQGTESSVKEQHVFRVKTIKQTADSCSK